MKKYAIIVAGGVGARLCAEHPKQFVQLCGKPMIYYSIEAFSAIRDIEIILVLHPDYLMAGVAIKSAFPSTGFKITSGGSERFHSVCNGLELVNEEDALVAVHDAARPLVNTALIEQIFMSCADKGNAIPVIHPASSLRCLTKDGSKALDRTKVRIVQTPQAARAAILKRAMSMPFHKSFTDEATVLEKAGEQLNLVAGNPLNIKVTTQVDLAIASALIAEQ